MTTALIARVRAGRLILDEPTSLPEGSEVQLSVDDELADLDEGERAELDGMLEESLEDVRQGRMIPHEDVRQSMKRARLEVLGSR